MAYKTAAELHNALVERLAAEEQLTLIKNTGDGYFARTTSVAAAVRFALGLQYWLRTMQWPSFPLTTRVGIHAGEVADITTLGQADVLAPAADLVARVMSLAVGGQILLTRGPFEEAQHFVRTHSSVDDVDLPALSWLAHGAYLFKGFQEPVEVFEVGLEGLAPLVPPLDSEKAKRVQRTGDDEALSQRPTDGPEVQGSKKRGIALHFRGCSTTLAFSVTFCVLLMFSGWYVWNVQETAKMRRAERPATWQYIEPERILSNFAVPKLIDPSLDDAGLWLLEVSLRIKLAERERLYGNENVMLVEPSNLLAQCLERQGELSEARNYAELAMETYPRNGNHTDAAYYFYRESCARISRALEQRQTNGK